MVESTSTYAIGAYHHYICEFKSCSWWGVLDTTLCDKVCHWLGVGLWFSVGTPPLKRTATMLKVTLNTLTLTQTPAPHVWN